MADQTILEQISAKLDEILAEAADDERERIAFRQTLRELEEIIQAFDRRIAISLAQSGTNVTDHLEHAARPAGDERFDGDR